MLRKTSVEPPALNHYNKLLSKRPSSDRPFDSAADTRANMKMFMTMTHINNPSSDINNDSISSNKDVSRSGIGTTPLMTNNFTHEAMLLSNGYKTGNAFH